jgi:hypothetical protein
MPTPCRRLRSVERPASTTPWLLVGHKPQIQGSEVVTGRQRSDLSLLGLANQLPMVADEAADGGIGEHIVVGLPTQETGDRGKGEFLRQQTRPFLETASDNDTIVRGKDSVAGHHVALRARMGTDLAGKGEGAEAASDCDYLTAVGVNRLRGKNAGGGAPSARHQ